MFPLHLPFFTTEKVFNVWHSEKSQCCWFQSKRSISQPLELLSYTTTPMSLMDEHLRINDPMHYFEYYYSSSRELSNTNSPSSTKQAA